MKSSYVSTFRWLKIPTGVSLNTSTASIKVWTTYQLVATIIPTWAQNKKIIRSSSNNNIATVNQNWLVTAISVWNVTITATTDMWWYVASCACILYVIHTTWVSLNVNSVLIKKNSTYQLVATVTPADTSYPQVTRSSSNTSVATVNSSWLVTRKSDGNCTITVTTVDWWYTASCAVTCKSEETITVNFDSTTEVTNAWFVFQAINYGWLTVSWWSLVVNANHNDSWWLIYKDVSNYDEWTFQTRVYMQWTSRWWDQHISVAWWDFTWNIRSNNWPQHYFSMTTSSWYTGGSWISDWTTWDPVYSWSWGFTWRYVYEIKYENWTYTLTRYNDTSEVTESSTYTHRKVYTWLWKAAQVWIFLRTWFTSQNYNKADWMKLIYVG